MDCVIVTDPEKKSFLPLGAALRSTVCVNGAGAGVDSVRVA